MLEPERKGLGMKIAVVGTGAMGSVYAALLADAGNEVCTLYIKEPHLRVAEAA